MLRLKGMTRDEARAITKLSRSRNAPARLVERARMISLARQGLRAAEIAAALALNPATVRTWLKRLNAGGSPVSRTVSSRAAR